jgi:hypothetical protein
MHLGALRRRPQNASDAPAPGLEGAISDRRAGAELTIRIPDPTSPASWWSWPASTTRRPAPPPRARDLQARDLRCCVASIGPAGIDRARSPRRQLPPGRRRVSRLLTAGRWRARVWLLVARPGRSRSGIGRSRPPASMSRPRSRRRVEARVPRSSGLRKPCLATCSPASACPSGSRQR